MQDNTQDDKKLPLEEWKKQFDAIVQSTKRPFKKTNLGWLIAVIKDSLTTAEESYRVSAFQHVLTYLDKRNRDNNNGYQMCLNVLSDIATAFDKNDPSQSNLCDLRWEGKFRGMLITFAEGQETQLEKYKNSAWYKIKEFFRNPFNAIKSFFLGADKENKTVLEDVQTILKDTKPEVTVDQIVNILIKMNVRNILKSELKVETEPQPNINQFVEELNKLLQNKKITEQKNAKDFKGILADLKLTPESVQQALNTRWEAIDIGRQLKEGSIKEFYHEENVQRVCSVLIKLDMKDNLKSTDKFKAPEEFCKEYNTLVLNGTKSGVLLPLPNENDTLESFLFRELSITLLEVNEMLNKMQKNQKSLRY